MPAPSLCVISGVVYDENGVPAVGVTLYLKRVILNGVLIGTAPIGTANIPGPSGDNAVQYIEAITSIAGGVVSFTVPQLSTVYLEGNVSGYNNGEVALSIPATATSTLEALTPATFPIDVTTFTFLSLVDTPDDFTGHGLKNVRVNAAGTALEFAAASAVVTAEEIQDALVSFFPDVAPFDWTYDDAGDRVTLLIADATAAAKGLMTAAYATRLDQLEVGDAPTFAGLSLTGALTFTPDNTVDLAASGATRPRTGYFGTSVVVGAGPATLTSTALLLVGRTILSQYSDKVELGLSTPNGISSQASFAMKASGVYGWNAVDTSSTFSLDLILARDAANTLALRNSTNAQTFNAYHTYTDASNYRRGFVGKWTSGGFCIGVEGAGTGAASLSLNFQQGATSVLNYNFSASNAWTMLAHLQFSADNTHDIGASGATRPRNIYAGTNIIAGSSVTVTGATGFVIANNAKAYFNNRTLFSSPSDGVLTISNNAESDFARLQFGGTTSSFPSLKRSTTELQARLADDSGDATLKGKLKVHANAVAETPTATHTLRLFDAAGTEYKVLCIAA